MIETNDTKINLPTFPVFFQINYCFILLQINKHSYNLLYFRKETLQ